MKTPILLVVIAIVPIQLPAAELKLIYRHGEPIADRNAGWNGHVDFASWVDDKHVVFASRSGDIVCIALDNGKIKWSLDNAKEIEDWSVSRKTKRLAYRVGDLFIDGILSISVVDCTNGKRLLTADQDWLERVLRVDSPIPWRLALSPNDGRLIVCTFSTYYGRNGYVLDSSYEKLLSSFHVDASPKELSVSTKGGRVAVVANKDVLCVRDLTTDRDVFFRGERIAEEPESMTITIDTPFFSHLRDGGGDTIVYTVDNSWATGKVLVHNITTKRVKSFDAQNGHIELDVAFPARRIVLTGTSTDLTLVDFDGNVLAAAEKATLQRNLCVEFSPNGQRVLVGSWDNTLSIFKIVE